MRRINKSCAYFPCHKPEGGGLASNSQSHKGLEDCTFCYCPFYPCRNNTLGNFILTKDKRKIWSCKDCSWIHKKKVVDAILKPVRAGFMNPHKNSRKLKAKKFGIIILCHGSKVKKANQAIYRVIKEVKRDSALKIIEPSFLQLCGPNFHASVKKVIEKGCEKILVVPFFLFTGNHVGRDIPREIKREAELYKGVEFAYTRNIGCSARMGGIVLDCIREAL